MTAAAQLADLDGGPSELAFVKREIKQSKPISQKKIKIHPQHGVACCLFIGVRIPAQYIHSRVNTTSHVQDKDSSRALSFAWAEPSAQAHRLNTETLAQYTRTVQYM